MFARVTSEQPRRPQLVRIAQFLRLATGQVHQPSLGLGRDSRLLARSRPVVKCRERTIGDRPLDAALDGLMMHSESAARSEERRVFPIRQQHPRPLHPVCRLRSRPRDRREPRQILISYRQFQNLSPCRHDLLPRPVNHKRGYNTVPSRRIECKQSVSRNRTSRTRQHLELYCIKVNTPLLIMVIAFAAATQVRELGALLGTPGHACDSESTSEAGDCHLPG